MPTGVGRSADYTDQVPEYWEDTLYAQAENMTFWHRFEGPEGGSMPITRKDKLLSSPGDTIHYDAVLALTGAGTTGDTVLTEGNEEKLVMRQADFTVSAIKHAVRWSWLPELQITHSLRVAARAQLAKWVAGKLDTRMFNEVTGAGNTTIPTAHKFWCSADHSSEATLDADDMLSLDYITEMKAYAISTLMLEPVRIADGVEVFGLVVHPFTEMKLKLSADYKQAMREAEVRGKENPLFRGSTAIWDSVVLYVSNRVPRVTTNVSRNIFFGAQLAARGYGLLPQWIERDFSYGEEAGVATRFVVGEKLTAFDLNATETTGDATDDTLLGGMVAYDYAASPV